MKLAILNTSILTNDGTYKMESITLEEARNMVRISKLDLAIGHQSTADILSTLSNVEIPMNRQIFRQKKNRYAVVFKLNGRPPEVTILSEKEIEEMGYSFKLLKRIN